MILQRQRQYGLGIEAMPFEYACFVSYRHPDAQGDLAERFIDDLSGALQSELGAWMNERIYVDRNRMRVGTLFNPALANALCKSVCMLVVYTPHYFDAEHPYCAREYRAMEKLEEARLARLPQQERYGGLIIPIILRGEKYLPSTIRDQRQYYSFERFSLYSRRIAYNPQLEPQLRKIAELIHSYKNMLSPWSDEFTCNCHSFIFPTEEEVMPWLQTTISSTTGFPFRSRT
jgi:hypothetical protein